MTTHINAFWVTWIFYIFNSVFLLLFFLFFGDFGVFDKSFLMFTQNIHWRNIRQFPERQLLNRRCSRHTEKKRIINWIKSNLAFVLYDFTALLWPKSTFCLAQMDYYTNQWSRRQIHIKACGPAHQRSFMHVNSYSVPAQKPRKKAFKSK